MELSLTVGLLFYGSIMDRAKIIEMINDMTDENYNDVRTSISSFFFSEAHNLFNEWLNTLPKTKQEKMSLQARGEKRNEFLQIVQDKNSDLFKLYHDKILDNYMSLGKKTP
jgi:hypothetical protein